MVKWRHRDPVQLADEIERLHRRHDIRFFTIADENPTTLREPWRRFLEEVASRNLGVHFFATIRATDIVRDADILPLYRNAGMLYVLMGIESTDDRVLERVRKRSTSLQDHRACRLLRENGIHSIVGHIVGLGTETWAAFLRAHRVLAAYDGDYLNAMYVTPHAWTPFAHEQASRNVVQPDQRLWDYRHQVLEEPQMSPPALFCAVKALEVAFHLRPRRLWRLLVRPGAARRHTLWSHWRTFRVWLGEIVEFARSVRHGTPANRRRPLAQQQASTS